MRKGLFAVFASVVLVSSVGVASADDKGKADKGYEVYEFPPDKLFDQMIDNGGTKIMAGPKTVRVLLSRPRVSFVPEMLKSVEKL